MYEVLAGSNYSAPIAVPRDVKEAPSLAMVLLCSASDLAGQMAW